MINKSKKPNSKQKAANEREELKKKLLETYREGESNIQYDSLEPGEIWELACASTFEEKLKILGDRAVVLTQEEWLEAELAKLEVRRPKVPTHKVQDPEATFNKYRQKFVEAIRKLHPSAIEDLRAAAPYFKALLTRESGREYYEVFDKLKIDLTRDWRVLPHHHHPDALKQFEQSYIWGITEDIFTLTYSRHRMSESKNSVSLSAVITALIEENSYKLSTFESEIIRAFAETAADKDSILSNFLDLQSVVYQWVRKYHLNKDWLVDYAYYIIQQYSENSAAEIQDIKIEMKNTGYSRTVFFPFEYKANGWLASENGETARQYTNRLTKEFKTKLKYYIQEASSTLELAKLPKATKPPTYENVNWLVCWTVKEWDADRIVRKFFEQIAIDKTKSVLAAKAFDSTKRNVQNEINQLRQYNLPVREAS